MNSSSSNPLLELAKSTALAAAQLLQGKTTGTVVTDLEHDVKLADDFRLHDFIVKHLSEKSGLPCLSEETTDDQAQKYGSFNQGPHWIIDPIDGSLNYSRSLPLSCISIALWEGNKPHLGVIYDFHRNELFSGLIGHGAWVNNKSLTATTPKKKSDAICMTGFPTATDFSAPALQEFISQIREFKKVRLLGSAALSLAYVACGRADVYTERDIAIWDVAAGLAILSAAGGKFTITKGSKLFRHTVWAEW